MKQNNLKKELNFFVDQNLKRFYKLTFSSNLVKDHFLNTEKHPKYLEDFDGESYSDEINRAAIVFLHSLIEETLRRLVFQTVKNNEYMLIEWFCRDLSFSMNEIMTSDYIDKYDYLYSLAASKIRISDKKKLKKEMIQKLEEYLWRCSFRNTKDIEKILSFAIITIDDFEKKAYFPILNQIFNRRNIIVHNMDFKKDKFLRISEEEIDYWVDRVQMFLKYVICKFMYV